MGSTAFAGTLCTALAQSQTSLLLRKNLSNIEIRTTGSVTLRFANIKYIKVAIAVSHERL